MSITFLIQWRVLKTNHVFVSIGRSISWRYSIKVGHFQGISTATLTARAGFSPSNNNTIKLHWTLLNSLNEMKWTRPVKGRAQFWRAMKYFISSFGYVAPEHQQNYIENYIYWLTILLNHETIKLKHVWLKKCIKLIRYIVQINDYDVFQTLS